MALSGGHGGGAAGLRDSSARARPLTRSSAQLTSFWLSGKGKRHLCEAGPLVFCLWLLPLLLGGELQARGVAAAEAAPPPPPPGSCPPLTS